LKVRIDGDLLDVTDSGARRGKSGEKTLQEFMVGILFDEISITLHFWVQVAFVFLTKKSGALFFAGQVFKIRSLGHFTDS